MNNNFAVKSVAEMIKYALDKIEGVDFFLTEPGGLFWTCTIDVPIVLVVVVVSPTHFSANVQVVFFSCLVDSVTSCTVASNFGVLSFSVSHVVRALPVNVNESH